MEGAEFQVADHWIRNRERHTRDGGVIVVLTDITSEKHAAGLLIDARDSAMLADRAESGGAEVSCEYDEDLPFLNGEERGVKQILLNLLINAVKFTPRGGAVTVSAVENQGLDIVVADNGVGIAEEDQQRVFTSFVQLDASGLQRYEGAGLGLALVKSLAEMHDATAALDSTEGEGTTITVHFPEAALVPRSNSD